MVKETLLDIFTPWIKKEEEQKRADDKMLKAILEILEPTQLNDWCDSLYNGYHHRRQVERIMDEYSRFIDRPDSYFFRRKLQKKFTALNTSFNNIEMFTMQHFFVNHNISDFFCLYPEIKYTNENLYLQRLSELRILLRQFKKNYNELLVQGKKKYVGLTSVIISVVLFLLILLITIFFS